MVKHFIPCQEEHDLLFTNAWKCNLRDEFRDGLQTCSVMLVFLLPGSVSLNSSVKIHFDRLLYLPLKLQWTYQWCSILTSKLTRQQTCPVPVTQQIWSAFVTFYILNCSGLI